jgi:glycosyltransferase involved in cell wall biosynthesis
MQVYFLNYDSFDNTSGIHIFHLANEMARRGIRCTVLVPGHAATVATFGRPLFRVRTFRQARWRLLTVERRRPDDDVVLHAWTPREPVRRPTRYFSALLGAPYIVHLEDNEPHLYQVFSAARAMKQRRPPTKLIAPTEWRGFLAAAAGITCVTENLRDFFPDRVPGRVFWPACEPEFFALPPTPDLALRARLGIANDDFALFYPGNIHAANARDVSTLHDAVRIAVGRGIPVKLVRAGRDYVGLTAALGRPDWLIDLGPRPASDMPRLMGLADVAVQPGEPDSFNRYRFPCKLPMFLASARPVVLPACNIANHMTDGRDCVTTRTGSAEEMAQALTWLHGDVDARFRIGQAGRAFARDRLQWKFAAEAVIDFYQSVLASRSETPAAVVDRRDEARQGACGATG